MLVLSTFGCVKAESIRYKDLPPHKTDNVELLPGTPEKPFEIIGRVVVEGLALVTEEYLAEAIRQEAAELGAEAVFLEEVHDQVSYRPVATIKPDASRSQTGGSVGGSSFSASIDTSSTPVPPRSTRRRVAVGVAIIFK